MGFLEIVQMLFVLAMVLVLAVYVIKFGLARLEHGHNSKKSFLQIVDRLPLSPKSGLSIVRAGSKYLLLGVTAEKIECLAELDTDELQDYLVEAEKKEFKDYLDGFMTTAKEGTSLRNKVGLILGKIRGGQDDGQQ